MTTIKRFTPDYKMHAVRFEDFAREAEHGEFVKFSDYEALVSELASSRQINAQTLQVKLTMAETIKELTDRVNALERQLSMSEAKCKGYFSDAASALVRCDALAVESAALKSAVDLIASAYTEGEPAGFEIDRARNIETPATSAALADIEARGVEKLAEKLDAEIEQIMRGAFFYDEISSREAISKMVREFGAELREAK